MSYNQLYKEISHLENFNVYYKFRDYSGSGIMDEINRFVFKNGVVVEIIFAQVAAATWTEYYDLYLKDEYNKKSLLLMMETL